MLTIADDGDDDDDDDDDIPLPQLHKRAPLQSFQTSSDWRAGQTTFLIVFVGSFGNQKKNDVISRHSS